MVKYDFAKVEKKWQKKWLEKKVFAANDKSKKPKYYQLETFPYPSAEGLHVGHPKGYIAEDIHARYMRMKGYEVLYTIGWDAFGLPTENYAIKVGKAPKEVAEQNVKNFKRQVQMFGFSYDWDREINTSSLGYYKWTQWLFIQLFKKGLAYRAKRSVNWCPSCLTVLANEQVINNLKVKNQNVKLQGKIQNEENVIGRGVCERCGTSVEQRDMEQWFLKITDYAERLLEGLGPNTTTLDAKAFSKKTKIEARGSLDWPEATIKRQEDWIGKSEGALIKFSIKYQVSSIKQKPEYIEVFTTRPDTLFGATFLVISPELAQKWIEVGWQASDVIKKYIQKSLAKRELERLEDTKDKSGVFAEIYAINPATKEEIPVWVADYVLGSYGTGAIMAVPAHDERDFEFAKKFKLPIRQVAMPYILDLKNPPQEGKENTKRNIVHCIVKHPSENKFLALRHKKMPWLTPITGGIEGGESVIEAALREIKEETGYKNAKFVKELPLVFKAEFYAAHKNVNRVVTSHILYFELENLESVEIPEREKELHDIEWTDFSKIGSLEPVGEIEYIVRWLREGEYAFAGEGILMNSGKFDGMDSEEARWEITKFVKGKRQVQYKLRDWSVSRQRYWGVPIPLVFCKNCAEIANSKSQIANNKLSQGEVENPGWVPVLDDELPVLLPELKDYRPKGVAPLASSEKFWKTKCPRCGRDARRETETLDTFVDSSWYYLRYTDPHNNRMPFDKLRVNRWLPVDLYVIGAEHAVLHLLYSRFITKFLHDEGYLKFEEPFLKLRHVGLIQGADGQKMSKSRGNVVNPDDLVSRVGADAVRVYEMFMGPFGQGQPWDPQGVIGAERFLARAWRLIQNVNIKVKNDNSKLKIDDKFERLLQKTIKKVGEDIEGLNFNTAISALMILLNEMERQSELSVVSRESFIKLLYPFAPHMCEEIWHEILGKNTYLHTEPWSKYDEKKLVDEIFTLVIQVNGKVRDSVEVSAGIKESQAKEVALKSDKVVKFIGSKEIKKTVFVSGKLINLVI